MAGEIVVRIPGYWENRQEALRSIAVNNPDIRSPKYAALATLLMDMETKTTFALDCFPFQHQTVAAFEIMSGRLEEQALNEVSHHMTSLRIATPVDGVTTARRMIDLVQFLIQCGGLGVWVETSGMVHSTEQWQQYYNDPTPLASYDAFVAVYEGARCHFTCGMQNLELADVSCSADREIDEACSTLHAFNQYRIVERQQFHNGDPFATSASEPSYQVWHQSEHLPTDSLRYNQFGRWQLLQQESQPENDPVSLQPHEITQDYLEQHLNQVRNSLGYFTAHFQSSLTFGIYMFRAVLKHGKQQWDLWLNLIAVDDQHFIGEILDVPEDVQMASRQFRVGKDQVVDWAITRHHALIGGFSIRFERALCSNQERGHYDQLKGIISYVPIDARWCGIDG